MNDIFELAIKCEDEGVLRDAQIIYEKASLNKLVDKIPNLEYVKNAAYDMCEKYDEDVRITYDNDDYLVFLTINTLLLAHWENVNDLVSDIKSLRHANVEITTENLNELDKKTNITFIKSLIIIRNNAIKNLYIDSSAIILFDRLVDSIFQKYERQ